ncbi:class I SAM-dependent methyltransferase [Ottowia sp.]|uniref:class I SAM-dependent methyltransferase n=1 Tax=Ottowia sp. TaxID=1898956 RepID=UPI002CC381E5|nr:class I SAM-dependent methyltransferase [Ottowia sp.]
MSSLPINMVRQGIPSRSAMAVASLRAAHQLLDEPLVHPDPIALPLLGAPAQAALRDDPFRLNDPLSRGLRAALVVRSRFVEDELSRCVAAGVRQYVILGAGLDTFAYRNPYCDEGLRVLEVDHPGTQRWKQQLLAEAGIDVPPSLAFVAVDFERDDLGAALQWSGFRVDQPACISWMGVTMYLTANGVLSTLRTLATFAAGSCLCFDYRVPVSMLNPIERTVSDVVERQVTAVGEPWLSTLDPVHLQAQLLELGFSSAHSATPDELNERYFARRKDGLRTGGSVRIMCANK